MCDGKVSIPITISKCALLNDLDCHGFEGIQNQDINVDVPTYEAGTHLFRMIQRYKEKAKALDKCIEQLKKEQLYIKFAWNVFRNSWFLLHL